jgi:hypothetical protein
LKSLKPADESLVSSTTLQDDDNISFAVLNGDTWIFDLLLIVSGSTSGDIKLAFTVPGGSTLRWGAIGENISILSSSPDWNVVSTSGASLSFDIQSGPTYIRVRGAVIAGGDGNVQLQWAQNSSNATATVVQQLSLLQASKL